MELPTRPLGWLGLLLTLYLVAPLVAALPPLAAADWTVLQQKALWQATIVSFTSASVATALIGLGGIPLGYYLARRSTATSRLIGFVVQLPLALPPLASGVLLLFLVGPYSPIGGAFADMGLPLTDSFAGIVLAETFVAAPFLIVAARSAFASIDPGIEDVAATLGQHAGARFFKISLPLAGPSILAGLLLAWLRASGEFGATVMVAYHPYSLPVFTFVSFGSQGLPAMLPILLPTLLSALLIVALVAVLRRASRRAAGASRNLRRIEAALNAEQAPTPRDGSGSAARAVQLDLRLVRAYDDFRLDLTLRTASRRLAILGPSGSGKSLTLRLLAGLERTAACTIRLDGTILHTEPAEARHIAYVPQNYGLFPHLSVADQVLFAPDARPPVAAYWLRRLDLLPLLARRPAELSLGQQQRAAWARAFARPARLILLDEPFTALDTPLRAHLRRLLRSLQADLDATTILVTHDPQDALLLADEIVVIEDGRLLQHGTTEALFRQPNSVEVARLLGIENVFPGTIGDDGRPVLVTGQEPIVLDRPADGLAPGTACLVRVPKTAVRLSTDGAYRANAIDRIPTADGMRMLLQVGVLAIECAGADCTQHVSSAAIQPAFSIDVSQTDIWPAIREPFDPSPRVRVEGVTRQTYPRA